MSFRLVGIGGTSTHEILLFVASDSLDVARRAAVELLRLHPDLEGVEIFDPQRFVEVVEPPAQ